MAGNSSTARGGAFEFTVRSAEQAEVSGPLVFATARRAREAGVKALRAGASSLVIDCASLGKADSAGLAVLLDWLAEARGAGRHLRFEHLPEELLRLARISAVDTLLQQGV
ncbi:MAG: STAS domain-containing protein [Steroidobacteraceae bacterium]